MKCRTRTASVMLAIFTVMLAVAACGGSGDKDFQKGDLADLPLGGSEAPPGTKLNPKSVGTNFLEREGGNEDFFKLLRPFGFVADSGSEFIGSPKQIAYAESLAFLFRDADGASKAVAALHKQFPQLARGAKEVSSPGLGEESWGVSGVFAPKSPPGYFYTWREGDVVLSFTMSGKPTVVTEGQVRAYAAKLDAHAS
jgi:hypothetical protein